MGWLGSPQLGVSGAAWATLAARCLLIASVGAIIYTQWGQEIRKNSNGYTGPRPKMLREMIPHTLATSGMYTTEYLVFLIMEIIAMKLGVEALAAHQIGLQLTAVISLLVIALESASAIRVGDAFGTKNTSLTRIRTKTSFVSSGLLLIPAGTVLFFFRHSIAGFFSEDPSLLLLCGAVLVPVAVMTLGDGLQYISRGCLRGMAETQGSLWGMIGGYFCVAIPLMLLSFYSDGSSIVSLWWCLCLGTVVNGFVICFLLGKKLTH